METKNDWFSKWQKHGVYLFSFLQTWWHILSLAHHIVRQELRFCGELIEGEMKMSVVLLCPMARQNAVRWECRGLRACLILALRVPLRVREQSCGLVSECGSSSCTSLGSLPLALTEPCSSQRGAACCRCGLVTRELPITNNEKYGSLQAAAKLVTIVPPNLECLLKTQISASSAAT